MFWYLGIFYYASFQLGNLIYYKEFIISRKSQFKFKQGIVSLLLLTCILPVTALSLLNGIFYLMNNMLLQKALFCSFYGWVILHCIYVPHLLHTFLCWWAFRLLPCPGYCKLCCNKYSGACSFSNYGFLQLYAQEWDCCVIW